MKRFLFLLTLLLAFVTLPAWAQMQNPVKFTVNYKRVSATEVDIVFSGTIGAGWHVYSTGLGDGGPTSATFGVDKIEGAELVGSLKAGAGERNKHDAIFDMPVRYFEGSCTFTQRIRLTASEYAVKGYLTYGACNDQNCLPPTNVDASLIGTDGPKAASPEEKASATPTGKAAGTAETTGSAILNGPAAMV
ncbi:MAG TPA: thiol:disulfide interchange protein, partial [Candidatus Caccomonas pullistercoris]|nr:thiol:disulfide interchange protein [Candidatus Caccomonas pullistercoris]